jgi:alcohol dehydrogenase class IV
MPSLWPSCSVPGSRGAFLSREAEDALWQQVFMAQPARRRAFEPSSKRRCWSCQGPTPSPLILIPITSGTGSEVTQISIVTTPTTEKKGVVSPRLLPDWAILDPKLTLGLPAHVTAATSIDAMVHVIEAYTSRHKKNPTSDQLARQALALLSANIRTACREGGT